MRLYVPATVADLRRLEGEGTLPAQDAPVALAVTPWVLAELGLDDAEDEEAEHSVLVAAAETQGAGGASTATCRGAGSRRSTSFRTCVGTPGTSFLTWWQR